VQGGPLQGQEVSGEIEEGGEGDRGRGAEQSRPDDRGDRVGRVMKAIQEVERERDDDQADQEGKGELVHQGSPCPRHGR